MPVATVSKHDCLPSLNPGSSKHKQGARWVDLTTQHEMEALSPDNSPVCQYRWCDTHTQYSPFHSIPVFTSPSLGNDPHTERTLAAACRPTARYERCNKDKQARKKGMGERPCQTQRGYDAVRMKIMKPSDSSSFSSTQPSRILRTNIIATRTTNPASNSETSQKLAPSSCLSREKLGLFGSPPILKPSIPLSLLFVLTSLGVGTPFAAVVNTPGDLSASFKLP